MFKTTDGGRTWDKILYISEKVGVVDVEMDPEDDQILYACTWERDRKAWGHIVGGAGSAFYKSTDRGDSWICISPDLSTDSGPEKHNTPPYGGLASSSIPYGTMTTISESPIKPGLIYIGTDLGVYVSLDKGKIWHSLCLNLPTTPVYDLVVHSREGELVAGTHGRSIYVMDIKPVQDFER